MWRYNKFSVIININNYHSRHDVRRHVTSNKTYDFYMFYKCVNFVPIDSKISTHIGWTYTKECIDQNNVTYGNQISHYKA